MKRRSFIEFLGLATTGIIVAPGIMSCQSDVDQSHSNDQNHSEKKESFLIPGILPSTEDAVILSEGLAYSILIKWGDQINDQQYFGFNNDFTQFLPIDDEKAILWVNHEYIDPRFISGENWKQNRTKEVIAKELKEVGGSFIGLKKDGEHWRFDPNFKGNQRIDGHTLIPFNWDEPIFQQTAAMGTLANCSGGRTPWGSILTCEENYDSYYGERLDDGGFYPSYAAWETQFPNPPEHYGWVVEVNPTTFEAQKHVALGRFAHECACLKELEDGRLVVYSGDDAKNEHLYKFIGSKPGSLKEGILYVADTSNGKWISMDIDEQPVLQQNFKNQTEVLTYCRRAAKLLGATPLDRPEDIEIDPITGDVFIALTNNQAKGNYHGSILKISESNLQYDGFSFDADVFLAGGEETGFACPDNLMFDTKGNLWFTSDISGGDTSLPEYAAYGNNGLFVVPRSGEQAGKVIQMASAPIDAEFTGPCLSDDQKTLFLSVQHPGEYSPSLSELSSHWPEGGNATPKPSVICITGELLEQITG